MAKLAIIATIKTVSGKRDEYLKHLKAHGERCLSTEPGTLKFEILVPKEEPDTLMLYEVYASPEAFQTHWTGRSIQQVRQAFSTEDGTITIDIEVGPCDSKKESDIKSCRIFAESSATPEVGTHLVSENVIVHCD
jgi:quinol monooxygenase YgiN